ncbi:hypothetical protein GCM10027440_33690 [Nocardiopsis coralliicola]
MLPPGSPAPDGVADAGPAPDAARVRALAAAGGPVLVRCEGGAPGAETARVALAAWLGATHVTAAGTGAAEDALAMVAAIRGTRPPAVARRGLA